MSYKISIEHVENGFILNWKEESDFEPGLFFERQKVQQANCEDEDNDMRAALLNALDDIIDHFSLGYKKHHSEQDKFIKLSLVPGDKYFDE